MVRVFVRDVHNVSSTYCHSTVLRQKRGGQSCFCFECTMVCQNYCQHYCQTYWWQKEIIIIIFYVLLSCAAGYSNVPVHTTIHTSMFLTAPPAAHVYHTRSCTTSTLPVKNWLEPQCEIPNWFEPYQCVKHQTCSKMYLKFWNNAPILFFSLLCI